MLSKEQAHQLSNLLQMLMSAIEIGNIQQAKEYVIKITAFMRANTENWWPPNAMSNKHISAKKAWARISERAQLGEKFGFIACLGILYKGGFITRGDVVARLNDARITRGDLVKFREHTGQAGDPQPGSVHRAIGPDHVPASREQANAQSREPATKQQMSHQNVLELPLRP
jgi:hypothetical protein